MIDMDKEFQERRQAWWDSPDGRRETARFAGPLQSEDRAPLRTVTKRKPRLGDGVKPLGKPNG